RGPTARPLDRPVRARALHARGTHLRPRRLDPRRDPARARQGDCTAVDPAAHRWGLGRACAAVRVERASAARRRAAARGGRLRADAPALPPGLRPVASEADRPRVITWRVPVAVLVLLGALAAIGYAS